MKKLQLLIAYIVPPSGARGQYTKAIFCLLILLSAANLVAHAEVPDVDVNAAVPIDGGLSLLVAAGVGYGAKKLKGRKQKM